MFAYVRKDQGMMVSDNLFTAGKMLIQKTSAYTISLMSTPAILVRFLLILL